MRGFALVVVFTAMVAVLMGGQSSEASGPRGCEINEILNLEGWKVPGIAKAVVTLGNARWTTGGMEGVFVEKLKSEVPETAVPLVSCVSGHPGRLRIRDQAIRVLEILRFTMNGRVFAYRITAQLVKIESQKIRVPLGSEVMLTFYDEDGSGRFTVMQYPGPGLIPRLDVPEWVKHSPK
jgi:hypothetical protein